MASKSKKLWGGRFSGPGDPRVEAFTDSTRYEDRLLPYDIEGSLAHAAVLRRAGVLRPAELRRLQAGLNRIRGEWERGRFRLKPAFEDVHGNVEARLRALIGPLAGKLHSGRSRNDQVALDERLWLRDTVTLFAARLRQAQRAFLALGEKNWDAVMPGYTHLQRAQPILFGHWALAYVEMLRRDEARMGRVFEELDECPLGAGALAGSPLRLDRAYAARLLGFRRACENSLDAVSNRDYLIEFAAALALLMSHLSRLGEEIVLFSSQEFGFLAVADAFSTGSSLMPQKKNADVAELLRGRAGLANALLVQLLTVMKGLPLAYNRDMQEDKELLFLASDSALACVAILPGLLGALAPDRARMRAACEEGFLEATDAADYLVKKGVPFREAHEAAGRAVRLCLATRRKLRELHLSQWRRCHAAFDAGVFGAIDLKRVVSARSLAGGTAPAQVRAALRRARARLGR